MQQRVILTMKEFVFLRTGEIVNGFAHVADKVLYALLRTGEAELWTEDPPRLQRVLNVAEVHELQDSVQRMRRSDCAFCRSALTEPQQIQFCCALCEEDVHQEPDTVERATDALLDEYFNGERTL